MSEQQPDQPAVKQADQWVGRITVGTTLAALALSYRNQFDFATQHGGYPVWAALVFPLMIDSPVIVGELRLFALTARGEKGFRIKAWAWSLTLIGLAISMAFGMAHAGLPAWLPGERLAAAVAPLAAAASFGTGLGIVKLRAREAGRAVASAGNDDAGTVAAQRPPRGTAPAAPARPRARHLGQATPAPSAEVLAQMISADVAAGLPMGRRAFWHRHEDEGVTEHVARTALSAANGSH